uniref:Prokaryotic-type class I peptide chain release factors domain-containing protein n=1 Tax=Chromera velia CCMP2878 TaxID=1169474 RepID=A0A0G4G5I3_9ALVE|eukprot:Cvel_4184.t1-p1 / transcript=Cvel_4184.t1 / gene=Cvel_4184 / organism=Chromera_velia_CCMP2878 / gene_product=Peptide chain release factor 2, putative / transcript_product=Peptide chain release factor 2, putative / location=Cvel_scaffold180:87493-93982(+) / protein_length=434 / sequence_SO=supercontig / SO=protein_coding / is_pseudo=false
MGGIHLLRLSGGKTTLSLGVKRKLERNFAGWPLVRRAGCSEWELERGRKYSSTSAAFSPPSSVASSCAWQRAVTEKLKARLDAVCATEREESRDGVGAVSGGELFLLREEISNLQKALDEDVELLSLAEELGDSKETLEEMRDEIKRREEEVQRLSETVANTLLPRGGCFLEIISGAGGIEAMDFVKILVEMYCQWSRQQSAERPGEVEEAAVLSVTEGEGGGYRSASLRVGGERSFGFLEGEAGVHRLIRNSPFNRAGKRMTSFAAVAVFPERTQDLKAGGRGEDDLRSEGLKIETFRSSGPGGQSVNTLDSAVRITHLPSGLSVVCRASSSPLENKRAALSLLQAKLDSIEKAKAAERAREYASPLDDVSFGRQIRTYTLDPTQLVKDGRTKLQSQDVDGVLSGRTLQEFIEQFLLWKLLGESFAYLNDRKS